MDAVVTLAANVVSRRYEDLPPQVVDVTKMSILDTVGVMLAASSVSVGEGCQQIIDLVREFGGKPESTILAFGDRVPCYLAAFANGSLTHPLDYDDYREGAHVHPTSETLPAALAAAERLGGVSGKDFIAAIALGNDLVCRLGLATAGWITGHDWLIPQVLGFFGGAAAAGKLLGLSQGQMVDAMGIALSQASGSGEVVLGVGSMIRSIRDGFSQKAGLLSALLAQKGVTGATNVLEGEAGLFALYFKGDYDREALTTDLGRTFEGLNVTFKPWPACRGTHSYVEAALSLARENHLTPEGIDKIVLGVTKSTRAHCEPTAQRQRPTLAIDAKFSLPFTVGAALAHGQLIIADFLPSGLSDRQTLSLAQKTSYTLAPELEGPGITPGLVEIRTRDGRTLSRRVDIAYGDPRNPIGRDGLVAKFRDCARYSAKPMPPAIVEEVIHRVATLEREEDIRPIIRLVS